MERVYMRLQVLKGETLAEINEQFRIKVQLDEQQKENEVKLQFNRGRMQALDEVQGVLNEMKKADEIEDMKARRAERLLVPPSNDGDKEKSEIPVVKV